MKKIFFNKSIAELENWEWQGEIPNSESSGLVKRFYKLHNTKIKDLTPSDIDLYVEQEYGLEYVIPIAIELLEKDILIGSDYVGSLLGNIFRIDNKYWINNKTQKKILNQILIENQKVLSELETTEDIKKFIQEGLEYFKDIK